MMMSKPPCSSSGRLRSICNPEAVSETAFEKEGREKEHEGLKGVFVIELALKASFLN
jgi:hypothetical protein